MGVDSPEILMSDGSTVSIIFEILICAYFVFTLCGSDDGDELTIDDDD